MIDRKHLETEARGNNKFLTDEYLSKLDIEGLLRHCHPNYRGDYAKTLYKEGEISKTVAEKFTTIT